MKTAIVIAVACFASLDTLMLSRFAALYPNNVNLVDYAVATKEFEPNSIPVIDVNTYGTTQTILYRCGCGYQAAFAVTGSTAIPLYNVHLWCPVCGTRSAIDRMGQ